MSMNEAADIFRVWETNADVAKSFAWYRSNEIKSWWFVVVKLAQQMIDPVEADSMLRQNVEIALYVLYTSETLFVAEVRWYGLKYVTTGKYS